MLSVEDIRKHLRSTGTEYLTYEQLREITERWMKKADKENKLRKKEQIKDCPLIRGEGYSFLLSKLLKRYKGDSLTLDEIKELKEKKAKAKEHFDKCCEKFGVRELVQGKGVVKSGPTEDEIKYQQFEHIKELLEERNKFDTWILHEDPDEENETKKHININSKKDLMEIVEEKKRKMKKESIRDIQRVESRRRNPPTLPFYF